MNFSLKLVLDDTARRVRVTDPTWATVQTLARDLHGVTLEDGSHSVSYVDSERERVTLSSTPELLEAVLDAQESGRSCLRLALKSTAAEPEPEAEDALEAILQAFLGSAGADRELELHTPFGTVHGCWMRGAEAPTAEDVAAEMADKVAPGPDEQLQAAIRMSLDSLASEGSSEGSDSEGDEAEPVTESKDEASDSEGDFCHVTAADEAVEEVAVTAAQETDEPAPEAGPSGSEFEIAHAVLRSMGFVDRDLNESVLAQQNGRVDTAVTALLAMR